MNEYQLGHLAAEIRLELFETLISAGIQYAILWIIITTCYPAAAAFIWKRIIWPVVKKWSVSQSIDSTGSLHFPISTPHRFAPPAINDIFLYGVNLGVLAKLIVILEPEILSGSYAWMIYMVLIAKPIFRPLLSVAFGIRGQEIITGMYFDIRDIVLVLGLMQIVS